MLNVAREKPAPLAAPEAGLTPEEIIARATALRPMLRARQAECEASGNLSEEVNAELIRAGFYRMMQPRIFGGYEFAPADFYRAMMEISRGCSETAWVLALTAGHPMIAAFFPEAGQREAYGPSGEFRCPTAFNPPGIAMPCDGGYRISGKWVSASGIDRATHFITLAHVRSDAADAPAILALVRRADVSTIDDWHVMGMQGTGSKTVVAHDLFVPAQRTAPTKGHGLLTDIVLPGPRIHDNPMYYGRIGAFMTGECAAVATGAARGALDLYEDILRTKKMTQKPTLELSKDPEFLHYYGAALGKIVTAEAALIRAGEDYLAFTREEAAGGVPFDVAREYQITLVELQCIEMAWDAINIIYKTAGTSASVKEGQPIGRYLRNIAALRTHPILQMDRVAMKAAKLAFPAT